MRIGILQGNAEKQKKIAKEWITEFTSAGHEVTLYPFQGENYMEQMDLLIHGKNDLILAYELAILEIGMTGGDYYINKLFQPVFFWLDEPLKENLSLLEKRMNVTILFYSKYPGDVEAIRNLPQPLFAGLISEKETILDICNRGLKDLYDDV